MDLPINAIIMWFKSTSLIPGGWALCDGTNGTPDLRGKFIMGVAEDADKGDSFGTATHLHTNSSTQAAGAHVHDVTGTLGGTVAGTGVSDIGSGVTGVSRTHSHVIDMDLPDSGTHVHTTSDAASVDNLPPYVQLYYIMRIA